MQVRAFEVGDVAWASPLADRLFAAHNEGYGDVVARWAMDPNVSGFVLEDGAPLGFALLGTIGLLGEGQVRVRELLVIAVEPGTRRRGIGRSLLFQAMVEARRDGAREIRLTVAHENEAARALFNQAGFTVERFDDGTFAGGQRAMRMRWVPRPRRGSGEL